MPDRGARGGLWARRLVMTAFAALAVAGLADVFGQRASSQRNGALSVRAPARVRGGLLFQTRVDVVSPGLAHPKLVLDQGVLDGMQVSSIEPAATDEGTRDGRLVLSYPALGAGRRLRVWLQFQVDPTTVGKRAYGVELDDGAQVVARVDRDLRVLP